jgi:hypothetical protein
MARPHVLVLTCGRIAAIVGQRHKGSIPCSLSIAQEQRLQTLTRPIRFQCNTAMEKGQSATGDHGWEVVAATLSKSMSIFTRKTVSCRDGPNNARFSHGRTQADRCCHHEDAPCFCSSFTRLSLIGQDDALLTTRSESILMTSAAEMLSEVATSVAAIIILMII